MRFSDLKIKWKIILAACLFIPVLVGLTTYVFNRIYALEARTALNGLMNFADAKQHGVIRFIGANEKLARQLALLVEQMPSEVSRNYFAEIVATDVFKLEDHPFRKEIEAGKRHIPTWRVYHAIDYVDKGAIVISSDPSRVGRRMDQVPDLQHGYSDVYLDGDKPVFTFGAPSGHGLVYVHADARMLTNIVNGEIGNLEGGMGAFYLAGVGKTFDYYLVNKDNLLITESRVFPDALLKRRGSEFPWKATRQDQSLGITCNARGVYTTNAGCVTGCREAMGFYTGINGKLMLGASMPFYDSGWTLVVEQEADELLMPLTTLRNSMFGFIVAAGLICFLIFIVIINRYISNPLSRLIGSIGTVEQTGDLSHRAHINGNDEIGQTANAFNAMVSTLQAEKERQQALNKNLEEAREQLLQSESTLKEAQQLAHTGSWERDLMADSFICSEEILRIFEIDPTQGDISYEAFILTVHPEDREMVDRAYMTCFKTREPFDIVHRLLLSNGRVKWVNEHGTFYYDSHGVPLRSIGTIQDITERKFADDMLRVAATTFETDEGISITDGQGKIIRVNRAFENITGYSQEEVLGKNPRILNSGRQDKAFYAAMWQQLLNSGSWTGELWNRHKGGQIYPERLTITAVKNERGETTEYVAIFSDITERKKAEDKLRKYNDELEAINHQLQDTQNMLLQSEKMASIGQLAAGVAHEINNPIGYVHSNLGTLERYVQDTFNMIEQYEQTEGAIADDAVRARLKAAREKLDIGFLKEDLRALMDESRDGITRVKQIVQNLKDFSHLDASDEWHFADLHSGLESTLNIVNNEIKYKADVVREYGDLPEVECLSSQLNQVFMNLLVNAAHAIDERGTITIRTGQQGEEVWVEVADTGKGIAPEHLKKIFDPFFTTKPVGKGTGLGLSLSYGIIQKHHGRIEVQSEIGKGTTFRVWLPMKQTEEAQQS